MIDGVSAPGLSLRPYFNRYTEDAIGLCDALSSFSPQGKTTLHEISRVMSLPGERYFHEGKIKEIADYCETDIVNTYRVWLRTARHRKRYLMPAARINLSFELSSAVTYMRRASSASD